MKFVTLITLFTFGCAAVQTPAPPPLIADTPVQRPETQPLPADPGTIAIDPHFGTADFAQPLSAGSCINSKGTDVGTGPCPAQSGILMSEARAARMGLYQSGYKLLLADDVGARQVWTADRTLYETNYQLDQAALKKAEPTWMEKHAFELGIVTGVVVGIGMTLGVLYGVQKITQQ
jgi:hypothetical protein